MSEEKVASMKARKVGRTALYERTNVAVTEGRPLYTVPGTRFTIMKGGRRGLRVLVDVGDHILRSFRLPAEVDQ